ncbi:hypothetical protein GOP47_0019763 [Adiantum capillus-veneris]|uniref:Elongation factor-like 1 n=1 Tax=Adiantum capillus-veneris TaxID=13818 RepID=A0A9D4UBN0_ADICA|nr:hypothetical protein GOP47_0019763 [Adiantum capillus-veneris]
MAVETIAESVRARIRNICILAHVDHGKTTLADHLIASGGAGLLHPKLAGKLRFLDYRDDEQLRAITMKSSSIALTYHGHVINLIDSPGHVDFCSEVSTAARLSDGALVLVDACEGVHIQTHAVLRQAWIERVTPCLVLNKIDRLITELKMSPAEAYSRLQSILNEVNNIINTFRSEKYLSDVDSILGTDHAIGSNEAVDSDNISLMESPNLEEDEKDAFAPERGNVVFACALDGWGFRINHFASLYAAKLGASENALCRALWGDHYYIPKTKKIVGKKASGGKVKPMFVQFVLEPLWQVYDAGLKGSSGQEMLNKIIKSMNLSIPARDLQHKDPKVVLQAVMSRWLPLADAIFSMVCDVLPNPISAQAERVVRLFPDDIAVANSQEEAQMALKRTKQAVKVCDDSADVPCVVFVSKMFAVPIDLLPKQGPDGEILPDVREELQNVGDMGHQECFLAFARVFSGVLCAGQKVWVLSPLHDPTKEELDRKHMQEAIAQGLYMMMGSGLEPKKSVSAGNLAAIRGLGQLILKTATLSTTAYCWPFRSMTFQAAPIMRVALEPSDPSDLGSLTRGLRLLNRADPFVEISLSATGEHVIAAAGEVHLERCIRDLKERFAKVDLIVSAPLVAFKETIEVEKPGSLETPKALDVVERVTANGRCIIRVYVSKLPSALTKVLDESGEQLQGLLQESNTRETPLVEERPPHNDGETQDPVAMLRNRLLAAAQVDSVDENVRNVKRKSDSDAKKWVNRLQRIWSLGPRHLGPNALLTPSKAGGIDSLGPLEQGEKLSVAGSTGVERILIRGAPHVSRRLGIMGDEATDDVKESNTLLIETEALESSVISGFQLATAAGPLCEEPMWGLAFTIEAILLAKAKGLVGDEVAENGASTAVVDQYGPFSGQVMTTVKEACRAAMLAKSPRLVEAMYFCEVSTPTEFLGQMYGVLGKRRARVLKEEMREGTDMFTVHAYMPVAESFGLTDELRRKTSGAASPQLVLSHWEEIPLDPFFVPRTEEELEEFGDGSSVLRNTARKLIDAVRRRKGLPVEEKVVQHATKQRTLARKV